MRLFVVPEMKTRVFDRVTDWIDNWRERNDGWCNKNGGEFNGVIDDGIGFHFDEIGSNEEI